MTPKRVLLLCQDHDLDLLLRDFLLSAGYQVETGESTGRSRSLIEDQKIDVIVAEAGSLHSLGLGGVGDLPLLYLGEMGAVNPKQPSSRTRELRKPASLRQIAAALEELTD